MRSKGMPKGVWADAFLNTKFQLTAKGIQALQTP
jgi:hypothetical protein